MTNDAFIQAFMAGDQEGAAAAFLALQPGVRDLIETQTIYGLFFAQTERFTEAIAVFRQLTRREPGNKDHWVNLAAAQRDSGDATAALQSYQGALARGAETWDVLFPMGQILLDQGKFKGALGALLKAAELEPNHFPTRIALAVSLSALAEHEHACRLVSDWRVQEPQPVDNLLDIANVFFEGRMWQQAATAIKPILTSEPTHAGALAIAARINSQVVNDASSL